jgi:regulatory protein
VTTERSLRQRALGYLARREHSRTELERKLAPHAESAEALAALLEEFESNGWLSERRLIDAVVHARRSRYGSRSIVQTLRDKGVASEAAGRAGDELKAGDLEAARAIWRRKFDGPAANPKERARQWRFLQGRGFDADVIRKLLRDDQGDE